VALPTELLIRWLFLGSAGSSAFPVAGSARDAFRISLTGNLLVELIDNTLQLLTATQ
jgi:hypothetical protein